MAKELPYFRWHPSDAESDARYAAMNMAERGLYHHALNYAWMNDGLPSDTDEVGRVLRATGQEFRRCWPRVSQCFQEVNGRLRNKRQEEDRADALDKGRKATASANRRWSQSEGNANALPTQSEGNARASGSGSNTPPVGLVKTKTNSLWLESDQWFKSVFWPIWPV